MTFWPLTIYSDFYNRSDFPPIWIPFYRAWPSPNYEWLPWSICNGCGMPAWNAYPSGNLVPSPFWGLAYAPIFKTSFPELAFSFLEFSPWIPLGTFSILLLSDWMLNNYKDCFKGSIRLAQVPTIQFLFLISCNVPFNRAIILLSICPLEVKCRDL